MRLAALTCSLLLSLMSLQGAGRPNILLILGDDIGFSDLGCCGGEISTPNLDSLAANGLRFTQFYNTSRCCPTRAALLTGLYPHQAGLGHMMVDRGFPGYRSNLNGECVTLAEVLRAGGYRTYMCGKWHVTNRDGPGDDNSNWPVQRGFDKFYGTIRGYGNFFDPSSLCRQNTFITPENDPEYRPKQFYYTDALSDNAAQGVEDIDADDVEDKADEEHHHGFFRPERTKEAPVVVAPRYDRACLVGKQFPYRLDRPVIRIAIAELDSGNKGGA